MPDTTFLLIRHGAHVLGHGTIAGRTAVELSALGREQSEGLVERLGHLSIRAIYSSPILRAQQTAGPLAARLGLDIQTSDALSEIDFGEWTGQTLEQLGPQERWRQWNTFRSGRGVVGGEGMLEIQSRMVTEILRLNERHPGELIALFSHGDPIKSALAYWLGTPLDLLLRIEISLASVSVVHLGDYGPHVLCVNNTAAIAPPEGI